MGAAGAPVRELLFRRSAGGDGSPPRRLKVTRVVRTECCFDVGVSRPPVLTLFLYVHLCAFSTASFSKTKRMSYREGPDPSSILDLLRLSRTRTRLDHLNLSFLLYIVLVSTSERGRLPLSSPSDPPLYPLSVLNSRNRNL